MAEESPVKDDQQEFTFRNVQLFRNETLGTGSYGAVCKAKCDQLICAAKLLYPVLFQMQTPGPGREHRQPFRRFEQECRFLSRVNHPNIVQYLGTYRDPETNAPVLLMELMDESLTHFLESSPGDIPYHIQVNLSQDIAQALAFLHANGIIHRDLSSNNVLLIAGSRAKVTDFGMSRFEDLNVTRLATMTTCPGTPVFMSPEALDEPPVYTEKLDNFSFGVLLVQIVTRQFPAPTNRFEIERIPDRRNPARSVEARILIPEVERRQAHISLIEPTHPLLPIALECLKDEAVERPSSQQLCESLDDLKKVKESSRETHDHVLQTSKKPTLEKSENETECVQILKNLLAIKAEQLLAKDEVIQIKDDLILAKDQAVQSLEQDVEAKDETLKRLEQKLEGVTATLQQMATQRDREVALRKSSLSLKRTNKAPVTDVLLAMTWKTLPDVLHYFSESSAAIGHKAYFGWFNEISEFNSINYQWETLPKHPLHSPTLVVVDSELTTVGGNKLGNKKKSSNKVYSFVSEKWVEKYPAMPTRRSNSAAAYANHALIVAGGENEAKLTVVEILNTYSKQWSSAGSLPFPTSWSSASIYGDYVYVNVRETLSEEGTVVRCSLLALAFSTPMISIWEKIACLPVKDFSLITVKGCLLAVGGDSLKENRSKNVHQYNSISDSWQIVSRMSIARSQSPVAVLPDNKLIVVGGTLGSEPCELATIF